jgi:hypothetical protein
MVGSIFLSYAGADREVAAQVVQGLRSAGAEVWWDQDGIGWGDNWLEKLQNTLTECSGYLILVGSGGVRRWVKAELTIANKRHFEENLPPFLSMTSFAVRTTIGAQSAPYRNLSHRITIRSAWGFRAVRL